MSHGSDHLAVPATAQGPNFSPPVAVELLAALGKNISLLFSTEFGSLYKNGGIGTFYQQLARGLRKGGWYVVFVDLSHQLWNRAASVENKDTHPAYVEPSQIGVDSVLCSSAFHEEIAIDTTTRALLEACSARYWETLRVKCLAYCQATVRLFPHHRVYAEFHEMQGVGYLTVKASEAGLLGPNFVAGVTMHSGNEWVHEANKALACQRNDWFMDLISAEEHSFAAADLAMFPSDSLHDIVKAYGWRLEHAQKLPYLIPVV